MSRLVLTAILLAGTALPAFAGEQDFKLVNKTGYQINEVYIGPLNSNDWGDDIMGSGALAEDSAVDISFNSPSNVCKWDMKVKYDDGETAQWTNINLCSISKITLFWDKKNQTTRAVSD